MPVVGRGDVIFPTVLAATVRPARLMPWTLHRQAKKKTSGKHKEGGCDDGLKKNAREETDLCLIFAELESEHESTYKHKSLKATAALKRIRK